MSYRKYGAGGALTLSLFGFKASLSELRNNGWKIAIESSYRSSSHRDTVRFFLEHEKTGLKMITDYFSYGFRTEEMHNRHGKPLSHCINHIEEDLGDANLEVVRAGEDIRIILLEKTFDFCELDEEHEISRSQSKPLNVFDIFKFKEIEKEITKRKFVSSPNDIPKALEEIIEAQGAEQEEIKRKRYRRNKGVDAEYIPFDLEKAKEKVS